MRVVKEEQLTILSQAFDLQCSMKFEVRKANLNQALAKLEKIEGLKITYIGTV